MSMSSLPNPLPGASATEGAGSRARPTAGEPGAVRPAARTAGASSPVARGEGTAPGADAEGGSESPESFSGLIEALAALGLRTREAESAADMAAVDVTVPLTLQGASTTEPATGIEAGATEADATAGVAMAPMIEAMLRQLAPALAGQPETDGEGPSPALPEAARALQSRLAGRLEVPAAASPAPSSEPEAVTAALETGAPALVEARAKAAAPPPAPPLTTNEPRFPQALSERVAWQVKQGIETAELRLDPPQLGSLTVRVRMEGEQASIMFNAAHPGAREALEAALPRLREMLEAGGLQIGDVGVGDSEDAPGDPSGRTRPTAAGDGDPGGDGSSDQEPTASGAAVVSTSMLDAYA